MMVLADTTPFAISEKETPFLMPKEGFWFPGFPVQKSCCGQYLIYIFEKNYFSLHEEFPIFSKILETILLLLILMDLLHYVPIFLHNFCMPVRVKSLTQPCYYENDAHFLVLKVEYDIRLAARFTNIRGSQLNRDLKLKHFVKTTCTVDGQVRRCFQVSGLEIEKKTKRKSLIDKPSSQDWLYLSIFFSNDKQAPRFSDNETCLTV